MEKCNTCRWWHDELCCNICVGEIKENCSYFYDNIDENNVSVEDDNERLFND